MELPKRCQECRDRNKGAAGSTNRNGRINRSYPAFVAAIVLMLLAAFLVKNNVWDSPDDVLVSGNTEAFSGYLPQEPAVPEPALKFRKAQYLTQHFEKHGDEFPYATEEEYLQGANNVVTNPDALHKLEAEDGDDVYYVESTNEFVVVSTDGFIRTYFKADMDYYNRQ